MTSATESAKRGLVAVLLATAVAGVVGYVIQLLAPRMLPTADSYVAFSVYWATLYLCGSALTGIQQEVTRAAHPAEPAHRPPALRNATVVFAGIVAVAAVVIGIIFSSQLTTVPMLSLVGSLTIGLTGYLFMVVLSGVMYGLQVWRGVAMITIVDALVRALLVVTGFALHLSPGWIVLLVSAPFIIAFGATWLTVRRRIVGRFQLDVGYRDLAFNTLRTMGAAAATGLLVSGLPVLLKVTSAAVPAPELAAHVLAITITRAPIVIPLLALQSYMISVLRHAGDTLLRRLAILVAVAAAVVGVLSLVALWIGPPLIAAISDGRYTVTAGMAAAIVASAGLVGLMSVAGPALLVRSHHGFYAAGWIIAAIVTVLLLLLPLPFDQRLTTALLGGPLAGLAVQSYGLLTRVRADTRGAQS